MIDVALSGIFKAAGPLEDLEAKLRPGDILVTSAKPVPEGNVLQRAMGHAFRAATRAVQGDKTHSAMYVGDGHIVESRLGAGVKKKPLNTALHGLDAIIVRPVLDPSEREEAARAALGLAAEKKKYDLKGVVRALVADHGFKVKDLQKLDAVTCSTLITNAYKTPLTEKPRDATLPVDFLRSHKLYTVTHFKNPGRTNRDADTEDL